MHAFVIICGIISTVLAIYCGIPYFGTIVRGKTKPHQFTWLIFTIMNGIVTVSQYLAGGRASLIVSFIFFVYSAVIFVLSLRHGVRDSSRFDRLLLGLALATIVAWLLTRNNAVAIWLTVIIDVCATSMMILKLRKHPDSEPFYLWLIGTFAFVFSCLTLVGRPLGILYVRPIYGVLSEGAVAVAILYFKPKGKKAAAAPSDFPEAT